MRKTKDDAELTRQKILDSAMSVFSKVGYSNARLEDIAREAGVTRGALYHHFGGKPEVYTALVNERFKEANTVFSEIVQSSASPSEKLRALLVETLSLLENSEEYRKVQELVLFRTAYVPELEEGMQYKKKSTNGTISYIEDLIKLGMESGEFGKNLDPHMAAIAAVGLFSGVSTLWLLDSSMFSVKMYAERVADIFIKGISAS
jgi:TetR/AcrR family acrAB operon transcriptional repressor